MKKKHRRSPRKRSGRPPLDIVHEDDDLIVIMKPAGLLAVPIVGSTKTSALSRVEAMLERRRERAFLVHRIDRYTSGLLVFAKHPTARQNLIRQFASRSPRREYLALVRGVVSPKQGVLRHYLKLVQRGFRQVVSKRGDPQATAAVLRYHVEEVLNDASLVRIELVSGLKNQIRVQFAAWGFPVIGDRHYVRSEESVEELDHQALHASKLGFKHPSDGSYVEFEAPPPADFMRLLKKLRDF